MTSELARAYPVIFHDTFDLYNPNESEDFEVLLDFFIRCPQEELVEHDKISFAFYTALLRGKWSPYAYLVYIER
jgi:hypothetical protein